jgi:hypothetical protein
MKGLRFTVYRHPWQRLGRETTQGTWLEPPAKRVVRIVVRYLLRQGDCTFPRQEPIRFRRHRIVLQISTHARGPLRSGSSPHSSYERFSGRATDSSSIGTIISGSLFFGEFTLAFIGHAFIRSAGTGTKILFSCFTGPTIVMLFQKDCGHRVLI